MFQISYRLSGMACAVLCATPLAADTIATEVWAEWQQQATQMGQTLSADVTETDTGLELANLTTVFEEEGVRTRGRVDSVVMTENADGTLSVTFSNPYSMSVNFDVDTDAPPANIEFLVSHENLQMGVSGDAGARVYTYTADVITLTEGNISGGDGLPPDIDIDMTVSDLDVTYRLIGTDPDDMRFASSYSFTEALGLFEITGPPDDPGRVKVGLLYSDLSGSSAGSVLPPAAFSQPNGEFPEGLEFAGQSNHAGLDLEISVDIPLNRFDLVMGSGTTASNFSISENGFAFGTDAEDLLLRMASPDLPVPIDGSLGGLTMAMDVPLSAADDPQDVTTRLAIEDLELADGIWGLFDPGAAIPRNPATAILDITGQVLISTDLMGINPEELIAPPGELRSMNVNELRLSVGGAELTGDAAMVFAPDQIEPVPEGTANLELSGGNALLDALINAGLVPAEQGAFVRGMANVFARPGAAADTLESTIEFGADGSITANGVPIQ
ncbi:DUF2125 domain-containing protein [Gymnodinialimonas sp. 2305UL16-5]|uniref:DUF2125 domain-containing protein n=1 Tax=Gymnodinialimonas mytili TaxID=3126503 RepID=UPI0030977D0C